MHLKIKEITDETIDTKTIHFWQPIHNALHYLSGQFLTVIPEIEFKVEVVPLPQQAVGFEVRGIAAALAPPAGHHR